MSYEIPLFSLTFIADEDMSGMQYRFVEFNATGKVEGVTDDGDRVIGVYQDNDASADGDAMRVMILGVSKVECGGTVTVADQVQAEGDATPANAGRALLAASSDFSAGIALATGGTGDIIPVLLIPSSGVALA